MTEYLKTTTVYSKDNCPACVLVKARLHNQGVEFKEVKIGRDITVEAFKEQFPNVRTVPHVVESGE
jgi:glutaredoxin